MAKPLNLSMIANLRTLRLLYFVLAASLLVCICGLETIQGAGCTDWTLWHWLITSLAASAVLAGFSLRRKFLRSSETLLARNASDPKALRKWQAAQVLGLAFGGGVAQYGLILRIALKGTFWQASLFYAVGLLLLILWRPQELRLVPSHS
jgi:hypothetical protein